MKIGIFDESAPLTNERKMLEIYAGRGAVRVLRFDERLNAMLLERLEPGEDLTKICRIDDARATAAAVETMRRLRRDAPAEHDFPNLETWSKSLRKPENAAFPARFAAKARDYFGELSARSKQNSLLHGDLHHQNILSARREPFLAIDPKGIVGDFGFEISTFLNNPRSLVLSHPNRAGILARRVAMFSEAFEIEPEDLCKWAFAEAVLSACWTFEENGASWEKWLEYAELWEN